jgi:hypothetical protein
MKRIVQLSVLWASVCAALGQGQVFFAVPNANANVEGNSSASEPFNSPSFRMQMVISASQIAISTGASGRVERIYFRIDGLSSDNVLYSFGGCSVTLSTTLRSPDGLSSVFADNVGANAATIYNGAASFGGLYQPGANPQPFGQYIQATSPFWYIPSQGNLLLDIRARSGQTFFPGALDAQSVIGDSVSRVFANLELLNSGTVDSLGLVTRVDFTVIPEPSTWMLVTLGLALTLIFRRK